MILDKDFKIKLNEPEIGVKSVIIFLRTKQIKTDMISIIQEIDRIKL